MAINTAFTVTPLIWDLILSDAQDTPYASYAIVNGELVITHHQGTFTLVDGEVILDISDEDSFSGAMANQWRNLDTKGTITCIGGSEVALTNAHIIGWSVDEGDSSLPLGAAVSSRLNLSLVNTDGEWLYGGSLRGNYPIVGATVTLQIGVYHSGAYDYEDIGTFVIEKAQYTEGNTRIILTGSDTLLTGLTGVFTDSQTYPRTVQQIFDYIVAQAGITLDTDYDTLACNASVSIGVKPKWGDGLILRQALAYTCAVGGCFLRVGRNGQYQVVPSYVSTSTHSLETTQYMELTDDEMTFTFNRIKLKLAENDSVESVINVGVAEAASNTINLSGNPFFYRTRTYTYTVVPAGTAVNPNRTYYSKVNNVYSAIETPSAHYGYYYTRSATYNSTTLQSIADGLKTHFTGLTLRGMNIRWRGDPLLHVGNRVTLTNRAGTSYSTCVFQQSLNFEQGFSSNIQCQLKEESLPAAYYASEGTTSVEGESVPNYIDDGSVTLVKLASDILIPVGNGGTGLATVAAGSYLKGNDAGNLVPRTPAEVLSDIGAAAAAPTAKARAYLNATQSNLTDGTFTLVALNAKSYDPGSNYDVSTYKFTVPTTGYYLVNGSVLFSGVIADKRYTVAIYVNGVRYSNNDVHSSQCAAGAGQDYLSAQVSDIIYLASGQYVQLYARANAGANTVDVYGGLQFTYLAVHLLSI